MTALLEQARQNGSGWFLLGIVAATALASVLRTEERRRLLLPIWLTLVHFALLPMLVLPELHPTVRDEVRLAALLAEAMAVIGCAGALGFGLIARYARVPISGILRDLIMAAASIIAGFSIANRLAFNLHGIIATSAVVTAIVGFSLQDALANIAGGLSLQLDNLFAIGDWVQAGEVKGRVVEIRWRYTAIETRNGDTVLVPNAALTRDKVTVLGRSATRAGKSRRWIYFNVDFRTPPTTVIATVEQAFAAATIHGVAADPRPGCVLMDLGDSTARYALRYWLTDLQNDDPTDSEVRSRIYFALARAGLALSMPASAVFLTEDNGERRGRKLAEQAQERVEVLAQVELFATLTEADRRELAARMRPAPFARGEVVHRQGATAHWLYVLVEGEVEERVEREGAEEVVCKVRAPSVFGEMSLMTGSPRLATVVALTHVDCYRLDKSAFAEIMKQPDVAEHMARVLAGREVEFAQARKELNDDIDKPPLQTATRDVLDRIREYFGLDRPPA